MTDLKNNFKNISMKMQFFKFSIVGLSSTAIHSLIYFSALHYLSFTPQLSNFFGFFVAFITSYFGHRIWTFKYVEVKNENISKFRFFISALSFYGLNAFWVWLVEKQFNIYPEYALIGIMFITPGLTFVFLKLWVFKNEKN